MDFEFHWADYKQFGSDGSLTTLSHLFKDKLADNYGNDIKRIFICMHCSSLRKSNENLRQIYDDFEAEYKELLATPQVKYLKAKQELEIRYATIWPVAEELQPDAQMLKLGTFRRFYKKCLVLLDAASNKLSKRKIDFEFEKLLKDIEGLESVLPKSLSDLAALYLVYEEKKK